MSETSKLGLTEVVLKNDSFYKETYREVVIHYMKSSDESIYAVSPNKGVRFCIGGTTFAKVQETVHKAVDFYYSKYWDKLEGK